MEIDLMEKEQEKPQKGNSGPQDQIENNESVDKTESPPNEPSPAKQNTAESASGQAKESTSSSSKQNNEKTKDNKQPVTNEEYWTIKPLKKAATLEERLEQEIEILSENLAHKENLQLIPLEQVVHKSYSTMWKNEANLLFNTITKLKRRQSQSK